MCAVCGCGQTDTRIEPAHPPLARDEPHRPVGGGWHTHADGTSHAHADVCDHAHAADHHCQAHATGGHESAPSAATREHAHAARQVQVERAILARNDAVAAQNRADFQAGRTLALNLMSSPGAGKTTLLVATLRLLSGRVPVAAIEGDQETSADADRIRATGTPALQINTGRGCHLDATQVHTAVARLGLPQDGILFIENVGNLVCPAEFDLGETYRVVIVSVTEGEDKPLKYPAMFAAAALMVVTKCDLLPYLEFDVDRLVANARRVNPRIAVLKVSATNGQGLDRWLNWLDSARLLLAAAD